MIVMMKKNLREGGLSFYVTLLTEKYEWQTS